MYWSDWASDLKITVGESTVGGKIKRAYMDGSNAEVFIGDNLKWPNGLSIDYLEKKIYWCDAFLHRLERISLDGSNREVGILIDTYIGLMRKFILKLKFADNCFSEIT